MHVLWNVPHQSRPFGIALGCQAFSEGKFDLLLPQTDTSHIPPAVMQHYVSQSVTSATRLVGSTHDPACGGSMQQFPRTEHKWRLLGTCCRDVSMNLGLGQHRTPVAIGKQLQLTRLEASPELKSAEETLRRGN